MNWLVLVIVAVLAVAAGNPFCTCTVQEKNGKTESALSSSAILKNVVKHAPRISESEINESEIKIVKNAHEDENKMLEKIGKCVKDYTLPCPEYWEKKILNNGESVCTANAEYDGFCEINQSFDNFTENDKMNYESSCNVEWGCKNLLTTYSCDSGKRDYNEICPVGFIVQNDNSCKADITVYRGMCNSNNSINFTHLTNSEKENWSAACEAYWPCYKECAPDEYLSNCPKGWTEINLYECVPNEKYKGPCKGNKKFTYFTKSMKIKFEEKCKTRFVCKKKICEKNYEQQECPLHWIKEYGYCLAPKLFTNCNRKKLSIENLTVKKKKEFEKECSVEWPCKEKKKKENFCEMNWNFECPYNWIKEKINLQNDEEKKYICKADPSLIYKGSCNNIYLAINSDESTKREIASNCDAPWPCIYEHTNSYPDAQLNRISKAKKGDGNLNEGPITDQGDIYKKDVYHVVEEDENDSTVNDIMK
ncbi:CPW-WPC family protein [Plasmodium brasilianum]|uniref:CPW-WPC family protein, putative n=2 Tax=Plasmodium (Plasmodium) TaxID=418103 RepID=A0A1A8WA01_PLAMA|nr:CPW-WPC family protein, putative [Plasmodium malariae]KAI4836459.1 CPW-WPC family protein [Plasmodium brasilianum]SBS88040.1 CPW-WPC family protein, putative [Plasmodium malariae]SCO93736.1 CPW-WPC family protein, putative [Plasmodium malariae]